MNMIEYSRKALAFASFQATPKDDMIHAALGMTSDTGELIECLSNHSRYGEPLDRTNLIEECGDVTWFTNLLVHTLGKDLVQVYIQALEKIALEAPLSAQTAADWIVIETARIADAVKAHTIYGKPLDSTTLLASAGATLVGIVYLAANWDITPEQILDANIAKLTARYGAKFDQQRALNRDKDAENAAIEKAVV